MLSQRRSFSRPRWINSAMNALRRRGPARRSSSSTRSSSSAMCKRMGLKLAQCAHCVHARGRSSEFAPAGGTTLRQLPREPVARAASSKASFVGWPSGGMSSAAVRLVKTASESGSSGSAVTRPRGVVLDPHHGAIVEALNGDLDPAVFEACAVDRIAVDDTACGDSPPARLRLRSARRRWTQVSECQEHPLWCQPAFLPQSSGDGADRYTPASGRIYFQ